MAADEAIFYHGTYRAIDHVAAADIAGGEVVMLGNLTGLTCGIAHQPIANAAKGSLAIGGGVYICVNLNNAANYAKVYWDTSVNKVTTVSTNMMPFGFIVGGGGGGANSNCYVYHWPFA